MEHPDFQTLGDRKPLNRSSGYSSADTVAVTTNCGALDPRATETTELQSTVEQLTTVVHAQQTIIDVLTRKLNFVLSFLDIKYTL